MKPRESPEIARRLANQWGPVIEERIERFIDRASGPSPVPAEPAPTTALEVVRRDDGSVGISVGADRTLADHRQILAYFKALDAASPRVELEMATVRAALARGGPFAEVTHG